MTAFYCYGLKSLTFILFFTVEDLTTSLSWLDACLADKRLFLCASRGKVWTAYHAGCIYNLGAMTRQDLSKQAASILALNVMKELVAANYLSTVAPDQTHAGRSDIEEEIITYIAGYLLRKVSAASHQDLKAL